MSTETTKAPESTTATTAVAKEKKVRTPKEPKAPKVEAATIVILSALYGINENRIEVKDTVVVGRKITNKMIGSDPAPKEKKLLVVKATVNGAEVEKTFSEGEKVTF